MKLRLACASSRSRSENSRQHAIERSRTSGLLDLAEPADEAGQRRARDAVGQQEVQVFLLGQAGDQAPYCHESVSRTALALGGMDSPLPILVTVHRRGRRRRGGLPEIAGAAGAVAGQASFADRPLQDVALRRARWFRSTNSTSMISFARTARPTRSPTSARTASSSSRRFTRSASPWPANDGGGRGGASPTCNSPRPTGCRSSSAGWSASISAPAPSCSRRPASPSPISTVMCSTTSPAPTASTSSATTSTRSASTNAEKRAHALGPVLGPYHPVIADNVRRLCEISGLDEVSFHMSGTEAVMQAVRLARYHTGRSHLVRFCRRLSRLVGRRAARRRQSGVAARDLYAGRDVRTDAARAADAARHRLRAGQSAAGAAP